MAKRMDTGGATHRRVLLLNKLSSLGIPTGSLLKDEITRGFFSDSELP